MGMMQCCCGVCSALKNWDVKVLLAILLTVLFSIIKSDLQLERDEAFFGKASARNNYASFPFYCLNSKFCVILTIILILIMKKFEKKREFILDTNQSEAANSVQHRLFSLLSPREPKENIDKFATVL